MNNIIYKYDSSMLRGKKLRVERLTRKHSFPKHWHSFYEMIWYRGCKGYCIVNGKRAPYVGNICMDVCMIDVTGIECKEGDTVEIFGPSLPAAQLAEWLETIPYEILTSVSERIKRVYYSD